MRSTVFIALLSLVGCGDDAPPAPTVAVASVIRGAVTIEREDHEIRVREPVRVEQLASITTGEDGRASLLLDNGAWLLFDHSTRAVVDLGKLTVERGRVWVDATNAESTELTTPHGVLVATGATYAVHVEEGVTRVYCGSGEIAWRKEPHDGRIAQGETLRMEGDGEPRTEDAELWDDWTGGLADPAPRIPPGPSYIGALGGRRLDEIGVARTHLPVRAHDVRVRVEDDFAVTEVVQTFFNARSDQLEGEYLIRLPTGAIIQDWAVDLGGGSFIESAVVPLATERGYYATWVDPSSYVSSLSYDGPDRYRARLYPVEPGATVRVRLRYTEWLDRRGDMRTYVYRMQSGENAPPLVGEFSLEVDASDAGAGAYRAGMGARVESGRIVLRQPDFRPHADFYLDLIDSEEEERPEDVARAYVIDPDGEEEEAGDEDRYVLVDVPTESLVDEDDEEAEPPLSLVILVDASGGTSAEDLELARGVVEGALRQLTPTDRVSLRVGDLTAVAPEGAPTELVVASEANKERLVRAMSRVQLGGASDLGTMLRDAARVVAGAPRGAVLYLGDGIPTTGALDATSLRRALATLESPPRFFAFGIGDGANLDLLAALFGEASAIGVRERTEASRAVMSVLAEAARPTLRGLTVELGPSVERIYPRPPLSIGDGSHVRIVGRLRDDLPERIQVRFNRDGRPYEEELTLSRDTITEQGDIRKRWATGRLGELLDGEAGREALVELGTRFQIVTPWTARLIGTAPSSETPDWLRGSSSWTGQTGSLVQGFHEDPADVPWALGGRGARLPSEALDAGSGWRRRAQRSEPDVATLPEETWFTHVGPVAEGETAPQGDGGLGRAAVALALAQAERGPRGCYERKLMIRPDLSGELAVEVHVDGGGNAVDVNLLRSSLGDDEVEDCVIEEVEGIRFPATGGTVTQVVVHVYQFAIPDREIGVRRTCSDAAARPLEIRRMLWRERLRQSPGVGGALDVYRRAQAACELPSWRARRTLLQLMLPHVGGVDQQVLLYRAFGASSPVADYLRQAILNNVRTPQDVALVRPVLGLDAEVDWRVFSHLWRTDPRPEARLRLVRRWLDVVPNDMDLRLRLLALLEELHRDPEAARLARELRADPLADARVRTAVGEYWLRKENTAEARRIFSEIVERTPLDAWARRRLGDLYLAHRWSDDAYREYQTLARLRPGDESVLLLLARAAADSGRTDEALRLEQRVSESADADVDEGASAFARLWTAARLADMKAEAREPERRAALERRERETGALRDPPEIFVALTWRHPDDRPELSIRYPGTEEDDEIQFERAGLSGPEFGIEAIRIREREEGSYQFEVRRPDEEGLRVAEGQLLVVVRPGQRDERIVRQAVRLSREERVLRFALEGDGLAAVPIPEERPARPQH